MIHNVCMLSIPHIYLLMIETHHLYHDLHFIQILSFFVFHQETLVYDDHDFLLLTYQPSSCEFEQIGYSKNMYLDPNIHSCSHTTNGFQNTLTLEFRSHDHQIK